MTPAFIDRSPTSQEVEKLRLILSTYQDGTGMLAVKENKTLPGWRDFEQAVALAFDGEDPESKAIFDVLMTDNLDSTIRYGLSCKMRKELNRIDRDGRVTVELSNSAGQFWDRLSEKGILTSNYREEPEEVGKTLVDLVGSWHSTATAEQGVTLNLEKSFYLVLSWNNSGKYQLHQFSIQLPTPETLNWYFPKKVKTSIENIARHLNGDDSEGRLFEWYGESGGQLKYYPKADSAIWQSDIFQLEPLPDIEHGTLAKVAAYFPELWQAVY